MKLTNPNKNFETLVKLIGIDSTMILMREIGGKCFYIPKMHPLASRRRNIQIYNDYKSKNFKLSEIADKWSINMNTLWSIIRSCKQRERNGKLLLPK